MSDPRKPIIKPDPARREAILSTVHRHLISATEVGAPAIGGTGASFVIIGMSIWAQELAELDGKAAARYLRALADVVDPAMNMNQKRRADEQRSKAVRALYAAVDVDMMTPEGNA